MKQLIILSLILVAKFLFSTCSAQIQPSDACRLEGDTLVVTLDKRWNDEQLKEAIFLFNLDSTLVARAFKSLPGMEINGSFWGVRKLDNNRVEVFVSMAEEGKDDFVWDDIVILDDDLIGLGRQEADRLSAASGVNVFTRFDVFRYHKGIARFFLPGRLQVREVFLSGTFNDWSTSLTPMHKTDSGWIVSIPLAPGKYQYKYILDGRWSQDPYNKLGENDWAGGNNSVIFCYNYRFFLPGFQDARSLYLAGSFNGWNPNAYRMVRINGGWALYLFLRDGTYTYKYVVDGQWTTDPGNANTRPDGSGNVNSVVSLGDTVWVRLRGFTDAGKVILAGSFNGWNPAELEMEKTADGWQLPYVLAPGNYEYKFIVDGTWMPDPSNPLTTGSGNFTNSFLTVDPNFAFRLKGYPDAKEVIVTGSFNNWSRDSYRMMKQENQWVFPIRLNPGKYTYKLIVDGEWMLDPDNELWEGNEYGTGNSVVWIEP